MKSITTTKKSQSQEGHYTHRILPVHGSDDSIISDQILDDVEESEDLVALKILNTKQSILVGALIDSIPPKIMDIVVGRNQRPTIYQITASVTTNIDAAPDRDHCTLKAMAESTKYTGGSKVDEYLAAHESIWTKMLTDCYPAIEKPRRTVEIMIESLKDNPDTSFVALLLHDTKPKDCNDFAHRLTSLLRLTLQSQAGPFQGSCSAEDTAHVAIAEIPQQLKALKCPSPPQLCKIQTLPTSPITWHPQPLSH